MYILYKFKYIGYIDSILLCLQFESQSICIIILQFHCHQILKSQSIYLPQELKLFLNRMNNLSTKSKGVLYFLVYPIFKRGLNQVTACEADRWVFSASRADNSSVGRGWYWSNLTLISNFSRSPQITARRNPWTVQVCTSWKKSKPLHAQLTAAAIHSHKSTGKKHVAVWPSFHIISCHGRELPPNKGSMHSGHNIETLKPFEADYTLKPSLQKCMFSITS